MGIDKGDIPDLTKAPSSLLDALEGHLATLEGKKGSAANTPTQTARYRPFILFLTIYHGIYMFYVKTFGSTYSYLKCSRVTKIK